MLDNHLQLLVNGMNQEWQKERSNTQLTLGGLIKCLESMPAEKEIEGLCAPHSYRGYYCDLSFSRHGTTTAGELLSVCRSAMGKVFQGYKGGDFVMGETTPIWLADYGSTGKKIMSVDAESGRFEYAGDE